ncbi:uncharacterized protein F5891DRAFT_981828 [Suillus fuscotomentosus]|uniref:Uncharacterized protein n=1 Tax=Suillus fuscotomentosus TaxID=1912939 RepID=A0AAD4HJG5_9AGAM|nr:uncharacterized protein F5891DRAFT_981828 [Suillus fuscotomentosus]KAG1898421.1 hypothetical protein F5891DRAFT_981828 [Suillus fuscotomentosus]
MLTHSTEQDIKFSGVINPRKSILVPVPHMTHSGSSLLPSRWFLTTPYPFYTPLLEGSTLRLFQSSRLKACLGLPPKPSTKKKVVQAIAGFIKSQHATHTGIVHGFLKSECEELAEQLRNDYGLSAKHYHAGMGPQECSTTQDPLSTQLEAQGLRRKVQQHPGKQLKVPPAFTTYS